MPEIDDPRQLPLPEPGRQKPEKDDHGPIKPDPKTAEKIKQIEEDRYERSQTYDPWSRVPR